MIISLNRCVGLEAQRVLMGEGSEGPRPCVMGESMLGMLRYANRVIGVERPPCVLMGVKVVEIAEGMLIGSGL